MTNSADTILLDALALQRNSMSQRSEVSRARGECALDHVEKGMVEEKDWPEGEDVLVKLVIRWEQSVACVINFPQKRSFEHVMKQCPCDIQQKRI